MIWSVVVCPLCASPCCLPPQLIARLCGPSHGNEEDEREFGLVVLPVPAHHRHLCAGAVGTVRLQHSPLYDGGHGHLHLLCVCARSRASGAGVLLWAGPRTTREHSGPHELKMKERTFYWSAGHSCLFFSSGPNKPDSAMFKSSVFPGFLYEVCMQKFWMDLCVIANPEDLHDIITDTLACCYCAINVLFITGW